MTDVKSEHMDFRCDSRLISLWKYNPVWARDVVSMRIQTVGRKTSRWFRWQCCSV